MEQITSGTPFSVDVLVCSDYHFKNAILSSLNNRSLFLIVFEAGKSQIKLITNLGSGESSLSDLQITAISLCLTCKRERALASLVLLIRAQFLLWDLHAHDLI